MKHYAVTGNMGSGKTTVCRIFEHLGVRVFYADQMAQKAYLLPHVRRQIIQQFGDGIYAEEGLLQKELLATIIFNNKKHLEFINKLIHPEVHKMFQVWKHQTSGCNYTLYEAAILFETGNERNFDGIIFVSAPEEIRIRRAMSRTKLNREQLRERMKNQWPEERKIPLSDHIIQNDETILLIPQVIRLHCLFRFETIE